MKKKIQLLTQEEISKIQPTIPLISELISSSISDNIINNVIYEIRLKEIINLDSDYLIYKYMEFTELYNSLYMLSQGDFKNKEINYQITKVDETLQINNIKKIEVDTWAYNKTKIKSEYQLLSKKSGGLKNKSSKILPLKKKLRTREKEDLYKKSQLPIENNNTSINYTETTFVKDKNRLLDKTKSSINGNNKKTENLNNTDNPGSNIKEKENKNKTELEFFTLPNEVSEENDYSDEKNLMIKKYRKQFDEIEKDKVLKNQQIKEFELKQSEMDKKKNKIQEEMNKKVMCFDYEGKLIKLKPLNQDTLLKQNLPIDKLNKETILNDSKYNSKIKDSDILEVIKFSPKKFILPENYFQPNPLNFYEISNGVIMEYFGKQKKGDEFPYIENKMNIQEFKRLYEQFKPQLTNLQIHNEKKKLKSNINLKLSKNENINYKQITEINMSTLNNQNFKLNNIFDENDNLENKELLKNKINDELFYINNKQKKKNIKRKKINEKILVLNNYEKLGDYSETLGNIYENQLNRINKILITERPKKIDNTNTPNFNKERNYKRNIVHNN